jgi:hypothetical protein
MTYKILTLIKEEKNRTLWSPLMDKVVDSQGVVTYVEYSTNSEDELEAKLLEVIKVSGTKSIRVISDVDYDLDIIFNSAP